MRNAIGCLLGLLLAGCVDMKASYEKELADEQVATDATVVIGRFFVGSAYGPTVFVNDQPRCSLEDKTYCIVRLAPGSYRFRVDIAKYQIQVPRPPSRLVLPMQVDAGTTSFVRLDSGLNAALPLVLRGSLSGGYPTGNIFVVPMTKDEFMKMRPQIDRVKAL